MPSDNIAAPAADTRAAAFRAQELRFAYPDGTHALEGVSFEVRQGERMALLGANGSGKSTLLRLLCGLAFPTSGNLSAFGLPLTEHALEDDETSFAFRRRVQFVFQDADIQLFSPTVREEVAFGPLQLYSDAGDVRRQVDGALEELGIAHLGERAPYRLSGGEKRKVALASVLVLQPDVLLLDEPSAGLDPRSVGALIDILDDYHAAGGTIVLATHDLPLLEEFADRAIVLGEDHRLQADASVAEVLADQPLLERCNLVHAHRHRHGDHAHTHPHTHV
jgi:cobalt/nickel transport system ATP-binding protein